MLEPVGLAHVHLYDEAPEGSVDVAEVCADLAQRLPALNVELRGAFAEVHGGPTEADLAPLRLSLAAPTPPWFEEQEEGGTYPVYEGLDLPSAFAEALPRQERTLTHAHLSFTGLALATYERADNRHHLRTIVMGPVSLISVYGLVEAPARPREYALMRMQFEAAGLTGEIARLDDEFRERFLVHRDRRMTEVAKGYALQAVFYAAFGEAFCPEPGCRLYDAHWQEELLRAQIESGRLCPRHEEMLGALG